MKKPSSLVPSTDLSRNELVDMIGRLRAAALVDLPDLSADRQNVVRLVLESTNVKNDEPGESDVEVQLRYVDSEQCVYLIRLDQNTEDITEIEHAERDIYVAIEAAIMDILGGAKLVCEET